MNTDRLENEIVVTGCKQTMRAVKEKKAKLVILASDADAHLTDPIRTLCLECGVPVETIGTMDALGKKANIEVKAAACAVLSVP